MRCFFHLKPAIFPVAFYQTTPLDYSKCPPCGSRMRKVDPLDNFCKPFTTYYAHTQSLSMRWQFIFMIEIGVAFCSGGRYERTRWPIALYDIWQMWLRGFLPRWGSDHVLWSGNVCSIYLNHCYLQILIQRRLAMGNVGDLNSIDTQAAENLAISRYYSSSVSPS